MSAPLIRRVLPLVCAGAACLATAQVAEAQPPPAADPPPAQPAPAGSGEAPSAPPAATPPVAAPPAPAPPPAPVAVAPSAPNAPPPPKDPGDDPARPRKRPWLGGLGYGSAAPFFGSLSGLVSALSEPSALGRSYDVPRAGVLLGGGGGLVLFGHLWLGGKGYALIAPTSSAPSGEPSLGGGGGSFELGYVVHPGPGSLLIPFFGYGGFGYHLDVKNRTSAPLPIQGDVAIAPGGERSFSAGFSTVEAGLRFQRLVFFGGSGGMTAGFEAGLLASLAPGPWSTDGIELHEHDSAHLTGGFVRLNLGGGGFFYR